MLASSRPTWGVALLFLVLTLVATWPLPMHVGTQVIGPFYGDNLEYVWKVWWVKHALLDLGQSPLMVPDVYYPFGYPLAYGEITPIHTYLGVPLTALFGPVVTYNLFILASTTLSGVFTFLFVRELTHSVSAGIVAGIVFAFCPYRMARIAGNLPLVDTQWIPLLFLFLERYLRARRLGDAALAGVFYAASTLSSWYYGLMLALMLPLYVFTRIERRWLERWGRWLWGGLAFSSVCVVLILPFLLPYLSIVQAGEAGVPLNQVAFWSASVTDYLIPNPRHVLWGDWVRHRLTPFGGAMPYEFLLGWGWVVSIVALYGWRRGRAVVGPGWGWWIVIACLLSLGPVLKVLGAVITLPVPIAVSRAINGTLDWLGRHSLASEPYTLASEGRIALTLPALLLRWFVPGLAGMRGWGRFAILATFGVAVLAGIGAKIGLGQYRRRSGLIVALLAALIFFEFYSGPQQLIVVGPRAVDAWLAEQPARATIIQMPLLVALSGPQMFYTRYHGQRIASGYGTYLPVVFEEQYPELWTFPSEASIDLLAGWGGEGIDLVLIDEADLAEDDPLWQAIERQERLELEIVLEGVRVYRLER